LATERAPNNMRWWLLRSRAAQADGDDDAAAQYWIHAQELGPAAVEALDDVTSGPELVALGSPYGSGLFATALKQLRAEDQLASDAAQRALPAYLGALQDAPDRFKFHGDREAALEHQCFEVMEAISRAVAANGDYGWMTAEFFLTECVANATDGSPLSQKVKARAKELTDLLVEPAREKRKARLARWQEGSAVGVWRIWTDPSPRMNEKPGPPSGLQSSTRISATPAGPAGYARSLKSGPMGELSHPVREVVRAGVRRQRCAARCRPRAPSDTQCALGARTSSGKCSEALHVSALVRDS
jgi:hypothetical protein